MTAPHYDADQLHAWIDRLRSESLTASELEQLERLLRENRAARDDFRQAMRIQAYLEQNTVFSPSETAPSPTNTGSELDSGLAIAESRSELKAGSRRSRLALAGAAVCLAAACLILFQPQPAQRENEMATGARLDPRWSVEPTGGAEFEVLALHSLRLDRGELLVSSREDSHDEPLQPLTIQTPAGTATASGTRFLIGTHTPLPTEDQAMKLITRVLVLAGTVTLSTPLGEVQGTAGSLLAAEQDEQPTKVTVRANSDFAFHLYRQLAANRGDENLFFSPYSISTALTMVAEGARGVTQEEFGRVLQFPQTARRIGSDAQNIPWETSLMHTGMRSLQQRLNEREDDPERKAIRDRIQQLELQLNAVNLQIRAASFLNQQSAAYKASRRGREIAKQLNSLYEQVDLYQLQLANSLWGEQSYPFDPQFVETIDDYYQTGGVFPANFRENPAAEAARINGWVREQTKGAIPSALSPDGLSPNTRLVLASAIFFKGNWLEPFPERGTRPREFTLADGSQQERPVMSDYQSKSRYAAFRADGSYFPTPKQVRVDGQDEDLRYPSEEGFQMLEIPYKGDEISMLVILPRRHDGLGVVEKLLSADRLDEWIKRLDNRKVQTRLPKFKFDTSYQLNSTLRDLGLVRAFQNPATSDDGAGANFSGMTLSDDPAQQLYLSLVMHKALIDVNEKGTKAAAVTVVAVDAASAVPPRVEMRPFTPQFLAERPFVFLIRDRRTGSVLFLGRVLDPQT